MNYTIADTREPPYPDLAPFAMGAIVLFLVLMVWCASYYYRRPKVPVLLVGAAYLVGFFAAFLSLAVWMG